MDFNEIINQTIIARQASQALVRLSTAEKNHTLLCMADILQEDEAKILTANSQDVQAAQALSSALIDRLRLTPERIKDMVKSLHEIAALEDPVGDVLEKIIRPNGLLIEKIRVPIGVIAVIYESRPNVTVDAAALCFKSGNAVILKGGKESFYSNQAIIFSLHKALKSCGFAENFVQIISSTKREAVEILLQQKQNIDLVIPRGGKGLIEKVVECSQIPVLKHDQGICHIYIDENVDEEMAKKIIINAKCQRPGVCNAMETLLINEKIASKFLPIIADELRARNVLLVGCEKTCALLSDVTKASQESWRTEYLDLALSIRIVQDVSEAISHINTYGSQHSDSIITSNANNAQIFLREVNSAVVYHNASTRFTDGSEFGFGAEIGISTNKIHARGPVGLKELTTYKYIVHGTGQSRK